MLQRPKRGETEDDILLQQREFLASRSQAAARQGTHYHAGEKLTLSGTREDTSCKSRDVVDLSISTQRGGPPRKRSKFKEERSDVIDDEAADFLDTHDCHVTKLLADVIKERDVNNIRTHEPIGTRHGFPSVVVLDRNSRGSRSKSKKSLFALHFEQNGGVEFGLPDSLMAPITNPSIETTLTEKTQFDGGMEYLDFENSSSSSGQAISKEEMAKIRQENMQRVASMSSMEIAHHQAKLKATLSPDLVAFLSTRGKKKEGDAVPPTPKDTGVECRSANDISMIEETIEHSDTHASHEWKELPTETRELKGLANKHLWLNMKTAEVEKLEWMADVNDKAAGDKDAIVRFGLDGSLIPRCVELPVSLGLHHHGANPQAAGYSLEELFTMIRSSVIQQRVLALQVVSKILTKAWCGAFVDSVKGNVLQNLVDAGLPVVLRFSLDDPVEAVSLAAVQCLHSLLVEGNLEDLMDVVACTWCGLFSPSLQVTKSPTVTVNDNSGRPTEFEIIQHDLVLGLLRMDLLPRLRYLLEVFHLPPPLVISVLEILTRIARHSTHAASRVVECPRLLDTVIDQFLPCSWRNPDELPLSDAYGMPLSQAVKLVSVLCAASRSIASKLMSRAGVVNAVMRYISQQPSQMNLPFSEALQLALHSYRTMQACITYGIATQCVSDLYPILMQRLLELNHVLGQYLPMPGTCSESRHTSASSLYLNIAILGLVEACVHVGAVTANQLHSQKNGVEEEFPCPKLSWHQVMSMLDPLKLAMKSLGQRLKHQEMELLKDGTVLLFCGRLFSVIAVYYRHFSSITRSMDVIDSLSELEDLIETLLLPIINGQSTKVALKLIMSLSSQTELYCQLLSHVSITTLPSLMASSVVPPTIRFLDAQQWLGFHSFVSAICHMSSNIVQVHKGCALKVARALCSARVVIEFLECYLRVQPARMSSEKRLALHIRYFLVKLFVDTFMMSSDGSLHHLLHLYHSTALDLLSKLQPGDEYFVHNLVSDVVFRREFFQTDSSVASLSVDLADLSVGSMQALSLQPITLTGAKRELETKSLLNDCIENLPGIRQLILTSLLTSISQRQMDQSRALVCGYPYKISSLLLPDFQSVTMTTDWMFQPIVAIHNRATKRIGNDTLSREDVGVVCHTLRLLLLLELLKPEAVRLVTVTTRFTCLMCVFLSGSDLFLEDTVHIYLTALLRCYARPALLNRIDFSESIPGVSSFYDLYVAMLSQYAAVSYGDPLFGCFLLIPLQQRFSSYLRRAVWGEYSAVLRNLAIPLNQIPIPLKHFLYPCETDLELLSLYSTLLFTGGIRRQWSPIMYLVAVHHLSEYLFCHNSENVGHHNSLMNRLCLVCDEIVFRDVVLFAGVADSVVNGFTIHDLVPEHRADIIRKYLRDKNDDKVTHMVKSRTPGL
ncbi:RNA polymerase II-associated protein 1-like [Corticium candelabrum]|uniref:RNA polymerase II-associated protein 1-like n=1 Tax=Corticium candelabrum TaxID=121492 RepID=UPI002E25422D|nr:RNA polymerase II-associated protein 1-like [Corticium candelabrum]